MDEFPVRHLIFENYDIIMFYNYNSLELTFDFGIFENYEEINLIAWSMGVMIAQLVSEITNLFSNNIKKGGSIAINGTLNPINEQFGIHPKIYDLTIKNFSEKGREKFIQSMFNNDEKFSLKQIFSERQIDEQKSELIAIKNYKPCEHFKYDKILISDNDKIIPTKSQVNYWNIEPNLSGGHCPFFQFKKWSELL